jgi:hypothetical protein
MSEEKQTCMITNQSLQVYDVKNSAFNLKING